MLLNLTSSNRIIIQLLIILVGLTGHRTLQGQVKTQVISGQNWHNAANWIPAGVPTANDTIIIVDYIRIHSGNSAFAKHVIIEPTGTIDIRRDTTLNIPGRLFITNDEGVGLINFNKLLVGGKLEITDCLDTSLVNNGFLRIRDQAILTIDSSRFGYGIFNNDRVMIEGQINIVNVYEKAIYNNDSIVIDVSGIISLSDNNNDGIYNEDGKYFENNGLITMFQSGSGSGIESKGVFQNNGTIDISDPSDDGITNRDSFFNNDKGIIHVNLAGDYGIDNNSGAFFENRGFISIDSSDYGFFVYGQVHNYDSIIFTTTFDYSFEIFDTVHNYESGVIVSQNSSNGEFYNSGYVENYGQINCYSLYAGILNSELFYNHGSINIENVEHSAIDNTSQAFFENNGSIYCTKSEYGIMNDNEFVNKDSIHIDSATIYAISNNDTLINEVGGYIKLEDAQIGFENDDHSLFYNKGKCVIQNAIDDGICNQGDILNTDSITITNCGKLSFRNEHKVHNMSTGFIEVSEGDSIAIKNQSITDTILNEGNIWLHDNFNDMLNGGIFDNQHILSLHNSVYGLVIGSPVDTEPALFNSGSISIGPSQYVEFVVYGRLINNMPGHIIISSGSILPYQVFEGGIFTCRGTLDVN